MAARECCGREGLPNVRREGDNGGHDCMSDRRGMRMRTDMDGNRGSQNFFHGTLLYVVHQD